ncbi:MAG: metallophosphoesterase [Phycisphaerales bacterium]|nr:metallophosphoesterase [Phycisphaerales bacterium]
MNANKPEAIEPQPHAVTRRIALKLSALTLGTLALGPALTRVAHANQPATTTTTPPARTRLLRLAHLTDTHIQPEKGAFDGVAMCLRHAQSQADKPQLIVTGGDLIMDGFEQPHERTKAQWELWTKVLKDECSLPIVHTLGNHDIWGWNKSKSKTTGTETGWGKKWACEMVARDHPYAVHEVAGARLIILDSTHPDPKDPNGYIAQLDPEQMDWFQRTLKDTPAQTPVIVVSHIPIVTATGFTAGKPETRTKDHTIPLGWMHADSPVIMNLFNKHRNVKACLSGHMHELDRVELGGVTYLCNGAVSGSWWNGKRGDMPEGYALVDLFSDGSVERQYVPYGWTARA